MMGGAFTAISDDPEGVLHNPAGTVFSGKKKFSINGTAFHSKSTRYEKAIKEQDFVQTSQSVLPSFIGSTYSIGRFTFGNAIVTADGNDTKQADYFENISDSPNFAKNFSRFHQESTRYEMYGASVATYIDSLSLGVSGFYTTKAVKSVVHQEVTLGSGSVRVIDHSLVGNGSAATVVTGLMWRRKTFSVGLVYQVNEQLTEKVALAQDAVEYNNGETEITVLHGEANQVQNFDFMYPNIVKLGAAALFDSLTVSMDLIYQEGVTHQNSPSEKFNLHDTANISLGLEWTGDGWVYWSLGAFTNNDMTRKVSSHDTAQPDHIDFFGGSLGLGFNTKDFKTVLGLVRQKGTGSSQKVQGSSEVQKVKSESTMLILNMTSSFGKG